MSTASTCCGEVVFRTEYLERLVVFEPPAQIGNQLWSELHEEVQRVLEGLDDVVRSRVAQLRVKPERTQGRSFCLFSYRTFSRTDASDIDPVVVGLTFTRDGRDETGSVVIEADISGESTGDLIAAHARQTVPAVAEDLLHAAHELATELSWHGEGIAKALLDSSRRI